MVEEGEPTAQEAQRSPVTVQLIQAQDTLKEVTNKIIIPLTLLGCGSNNVYIYFITIWLGNLLCKEKKRKRRLISKPVAISSLSLFFFAELSIGHQTNRECGLDSWSGQCGFRSPRLQQKQQQQAQPDFHNNRPRQDDRKDRQPKLLFRQQQQQPRGLFLFCRRRGLRGASRVASHRGAGEDPCLNHENSIQRPAHDVSGIFFYPLYRICRSMENGVRYRVVF